MVKTIISDVRFKVTSILLAIFLPGVTSQEVRAQDSNKMPPVQVSSLTPHDLRGCDQYPQPVKNLIEDLLSLTQKNLGYLYGSADPAKGGMDCSGTIYFVLKEAGISEPPRSASTQYVWARKAGTFRAVVSTKQNTFELGELKPGDLLFWTGTYESKNDPPVTHTMIYLGRTKHGNKPVMAGSSDGRTYQGEKKYGVSVFDFRIPSGKQTTSRFIGYAAIPNLPDVSAEPVANP